MVGEEESTQKKEGLFPSPQFFNREGPMPWSSTNNPYDTVQGTQPVPLMSKWLKKKPSWENNKKTQLWHDFLII